MIPRLYRWARPLMLAALTVGMVGCAAPDVALTVSMGDDDSVVFECVGGRWTIVSQPEAKP